MRLCDKFYVFKLNDVSINCPLCWITSQDAHELFHVLTSSLEEERERLPKVPHFFDMRYLEVSCVHFVSTGKVLMLLQCSPKFR